MPTRPSVQPSDRGENWISNTPKSPHDTLHHALSGKSVSPAFRNMMLVAIEFNHETAIIPVPRSPDRLRRGLL